MLFSSSAFWFHLAPVFTMQSGAFQFSVSSLQFCKISLFQITLKLVCLRWTLKNSEFHLRKINHALPDFLNSSFESWEGFLKPFIHFRSHLRAKEKTKLSHKDEYMMGGRKMPPIPVALSLLTTFLSGILMLGVPAEMFQRGTGQIWINTTLWNMF